MDPEIQKVGVSVLESSFLLLPESKAALLSRFEEATDVEDISRIVAFLESERKFVLEFMKRRLRDGNFPDKAAALLEEMRSEFLREIRAREALEEWTGWTADERLKSGLALAFV